MEKLLDPKDILNYPDTRDIIADGERVCGVTGHMIDSDTRAIPRFPQENWLIVWQNLERHLNLENPDVLVVSGTNGVDLLAARYAIERGKKLIFISPFNDEGDEEFIELAVANSSKDTEQMWRTLYEDVQRLSELEPNRVRIYRPTTPDGIPATKEWVEARAKESGNAYIHYEQVNRQILSTVSGGGRFLAYWDGKGGDKPGGTFDLIKRAKRIGILPIVLNKGIENIADTYPTGYAPVG